jgi:hypothetical protein
VVLLVQTDQVETQVTQVQVLYRVLVVLQVHQELMVQQALPEQVPYHLPQVLQDLQVQMGQSVLQVSQV